MTGKRLDNLNTSPFALVNAAVAASAAALAARKPVDKGVVVTDKKKPTGPVLRITDADRARNDMGLSSRGFASFTTDRPGRYDQAGIQVKNVAVKKAATVTGVLKKAKAGGLTTNNGLLALRPAGISVTR